MPSKILVGLIAMVFCHVGLAADSTIIKNGNWWGTLTAEPRVAFVQGFVEGMTLGHRFSYWNHINAKTPESGQAITYAIESYDALRNSLLPGTTSKQLSDALTVFYRDPFNRNIEIADAFYLCLLKIKGRPNSEIEPMIENYRANAGRKNVPPESAH